MKLSIAKCCGSCVYVNKPKTPTDHAPHYSVAKTERWCFKNNIPTMREAVCDDHTFDVKGSCKRNFGRIKGQNERLQKIIEIKEWMVKNNTDLIETGWNTCNKIYFVHNDRLCYCYGKEERKILRHVYTVSCKDSLRDDLVKIYEEARKC